MKRRLSWLLALGVLVLSLSGCVAEKKATSRQLQPTLAAFIERVEQSRQQLPLIMESAEAVAQRLADHPDLLIDIPYWPQQTFAEELLNRSGGLAMALPSQERPKEVTEHDVMLFSMRSWQMDKPDEVERRLELLRKEKAQNHLIVLFASKVGMPKDLKVDVLIDNGASSPGEEQATVNALANILNGWLWTCEFVAAMTRHGKCPGILKSAVLPGSEEHNKPLQTAEGRHWMGQCSTPIARGELAGIYLRQIEQLLAELQGERVQGGVDRAADVVSEHIESGGKVGVAAVSHVLLSEIFLDNKTPWHPFNVVWQTKGGVFEKNLKPGDLLVWFGFVGLSTPYEDYGKFIRACGAKYVTCFRQDKEHPDNNAPEALVHVEQSWEYGDAAVPIPYEPAHMAPISGIEQGLIYRMLDDEAADRLAGKKGR